MGHRYTRYEGYEDVKSLLDAVASDEEVLVRLGQPALIRIPGTAAKPRARFVSCLLHGNEDSGFRAVLELLRTEARFAFDLWVFVGNVPAAVQDGFFAHRHLDGEEDFNRVWGWNDPTTRMRATADAVIAELDAGAPLDGAIDLHNNTGENPYYAIVVDQTDDSLALALTCADTVVEWSMRGHLLIEVLSERCPAVAVECGLPGRQRNHAFARGVLHRFLSAERILPRPPQTASASLLRLAYRVAVRPEVTFAFDRRLCRDFDLALRPGLDRYNFGMLFAGTELGTVRDHCPMPLQAVDLAGFDVTPWLFDILPGGRLVLTQDVTPAMMTREVVQTRRDCLFYILRHCRHA